MDNKHVFGSLVCCVITFKKTSSLGMDGSREGWCSCTLSLVFFCNGIFLSYVL